MKRILAAVLSLAMCLSITACAKPAAGSEASASPEAAAQPSQSAGGSKENSVAIILQEGGLGDQGYNDNAKIGLDMMIEKHGIQGTLVEATAPAEADTFIRQLAEDGYPLIICLDWVIIDYVKAASVDYPDTKFVVLGKALPGPGTQGNLIEPYTALHEWAFMAGLASILIATDGNELIAANGRPGCNVAVLTPGESVNTARQRSAYDQCIEAVNPDTKALWDYTGSYTDSALNQQIVENMIVNSNVEVVWAMVGTGALATFTTCKLNNAYVLGCDSNQDAVEPGTVATSVLHNTTYMVTNIIDDWVAGTLSGSNEYYWGLESGVVGLTDFSTMAAFPGTNKENLKKIMDSIGEYSAKIISGDFIVYDYFQNANVEYKDWKAAHPNTDYTAWVKAGRPA